MDDASKLWRMKRIIRELKREQQAMRQARIQGKRWNDRLMNAADEIKAAIFVWG